MQNSAGRNSWISWIVFLAGLWLIVSPSFLGFGFTQVSTNDVIVGIIVAAFGLINAVWGKTTANWLSWVVALIGLWEIASAFIINHAGLGNAMANDVILGFVIMILGVWRAVSVNSLLTETSRSYSSEIRKRRENDSDDQEKPQQ